MIGFYLRSAFLFPSPKAFLSPPPPDLHLPDFVVFAGFMTSHGFSSSFVETLAGFTAGVASTLSLHPLDMVKTRLQGGSHSSQCGGHGLTPLCSRPIFIRSAWEFSSNHPRHLFSRGGPWRLLSRSHPQCDRKFHQLGALLFML